MDKRGQAAEQVLEAGKLLFYILIALLLFAIFYGVWEVFFKQPVSMATRDRDRMVKELAALQPDQKLEVITTGGGYDIILYGTGNTNDYCRGKPCICESDGKKCVILQNIADDCSKGVCVLNCDKGLCVPAAQPETAKITQGQPVTICRKGRSANELHIGDACKAA